MVPAGQWPLPTTSDAVHYMAKAQEAVQLALQLWQGVNVTSFQVPFTTGGLTASLPGIFVTPDPSQQLPLLVFTTGTDYPKEVHTRYSHCTDGHLPLHSLNGCDGVAWAWPLCGLTPGALQLLSDRGSVNAR